MLLSSSLYVSAFSIFTIYPTHKCSLILPTHQSILPFSYFTMPNHHHQHFQIHYWLPYLSITLHLLCPVCPEPQQCIPQQFSNIQQNPLQNPVHTLHTFYTSLSSPHHATLYFCNGNLHTKLKQPILPHVHIRFLCDLASRPMYFELFDSFTLCTTPTFHILFLAVYGTNLLCRFASTFAGWLPLF